MKKFKSSDLTHNRAEVLKEARENGCIIEERNTNGDVRSEYIIIKKTGIDIWSLYENHECNDPQCMICSNDY